MLKIKLLIFFTIFSILVITPSNGQNKSLEGKIKQIDALMYANRPNIVIPMIDSLLTKELSITEELHLKSVKLEALVHIEKLETALIYSNELLKNKDLKGADLIRTHLERGLTFALLNRFKETRVELDFVRDYYKNPKITKDELYGEYLFRVASLNQVQNLLDKAIVYAEKAIDFGQKNNYLNVEATGLMIVVICKYKPDSKEYIEYREKALSIWKKTGNIHGTSWVYSHLYSYYKKKKQINKAFAYLDSSLTSAKKVKYYRGMANNYKLMSKFYEGTNNIDKALNYYKLFKQASDSSLLQTENRKVEEIQSRYNYETESLKNEVLEQDLTNEKQQKNNLLIGLIVLVVLIGSLVFLAMNLTKRRKEIKSKNVDLTSTLDKNKLLLRELNHRVNNNLALILSLVKFQYYEIDEPKYKDKFQSLEHRIKTIAAAHEQLLYSKENIEGEEYDVQEYLSKITNALIDISTKSVQLNLDAKSINLNIDTMLPIGILINELMSNSLKHAVYEDILIIDIQISLQQSNIGIIYKDSGTTFKETKNTKSLGVSIINSMVKQLKGTTQRVNSEYTISLQLKNSEK
ncbi:MAG: sensor histidine kinase [Flavobacteriaceae bacterium]